jgi:hypothetical protein
MPETETGGQAQEAGTETQGKSQEDSQQQTGGQSQEGGAGGSGPADLTKMSEAELRTYAAKAQEDLGKVRTEAAEQRTKARELQGKVTAAERAKMSETERLQAELEESKTENTRLKAQVEDFTVGTAVRDALATAGALKPSTAQKVMGSIPVKDGKPVKADLEKAITELKRTDPYLFKRQASANAGEGRGSTLQGGSGINDAIRNGGRR